MHSSKTIHYDFIKAIKRLESKLSDDGFQKMADDFFAKHTIIECQEILADFMTKLYSERFDRFFSAATKAGLIVLFERAHEQPIAANMDQINQLLNPDKLQEGGEDQA